MSARVLVLARGALALCALVPSAWPAAGQDAAAQGKAGHAAARDALDAVEVGAQLPPIALTDLRQSPARSFAEYYGRALLIEFFDYWSRPCAAVVPTLNQMQDLLGPRGLALVSVTKEAPRKTVPWIAEHGVRYAYAFDPTGALYQAFDVDETPRVVLVDACGTVRWMGSPERIRPRLVQLALENALEKPVWEWPESARALAVPLQAGHYADALGRATALGVVDGFDPSAVLHARIDALVAHFERRITGPEPWPAVRFGRQLASDLAPLPEAQRVATRLAERLADPEVKSQVEAYDQWLAFDRRRRNLRGVKQIRDLRDEVKVFVDAQAGHPIETDARELLERLDQLLEQAPPGG